MTLHLCQHQGPEFGKRVLAWCIPSNLRSVIHSQSPACGRRPRSQPELCQWPLVLGPFPFPLRMAARCHPGSCGSPARHSHLNLDTPSLGLLCLLLSPAGLLLAKFIKLVGLWGPVCTKSVPGPILDSVGNRVVRWPALCQPHERGPVSSSLCTSGLLPCKMCVPKQH